MGSDARGVYLPEDVIAAVLRHLDTKTRCVGLVHACPRSLVPPAIQQLQGMNVAGSPMCFK